MKNLREHLEDEGYDEILLADGYDEAVIGISDHAPGRPENA